MAIFTEITINTRQVPNFNNLTSDNKVPAKL